MTETTLDGAVRRMARGGSLTAVGMAVSAAINFALVVVVTRGLGQSGAGSFFQIMAFINIATTTVSFGADTGFVRFLAWQRALGQAKDLAATIRVGLVPPTILSIVVALVIVVTAPALAEHVMEDATASAVRDIRLLAPFVVLGTVAWLLTAATRGFSTLFAYNAIENFGKPILRLVLVVAALRADLGPTTVALAWAVPIGLSLPYATVAVSRLIRAALEGSEDDAPAPRREVVSAFWSFSAARGIGNVFQVGVMWLDVLLVGAILGPAAAGTYAVVSRLVTTGMMGIEAIRLAVVPELSALLARNDLRNTGSVYRVAASWCVTSSFPVYVLLALFAPLALDVFGGEFAGGVTALRILALAMLVNVASGQAASLLLMGGHSGWMLANNVIALTLDVVLNLVLLPSIGITGAAWAWGASIVVGNLMSVYLIRSFYRIDLIDRTYGRSLLVVAAFAAFAAGAAFVLGTAGVGGAAGVLLSLCVYAALVAWRRDDLAIPTLLQSFRRSSPAQPVAAR